VTKTLRTIDQIDASIAFVTKGINQIEANTDALRAELGQDDRAYVVGWPNGLFLAREGHITGVLHAKLFPGITAANVACSRVFNGKGERAIAMSYDGAIDLSLRLNADTLKLLNECLLGLHEERNEWEDEQRDEMQQAWDDEARAFERAADEGEYYDRFDSPRGYSLRSMARRIADSSSEYEG
jgi:hypothetical protein